MQFLATRWDQNGLRADWEGRSRR